MPNSLATARGESHLALVRALPEMAQAPDVQQRARREGNVRTRRSRMHVPTRALPAPDAGEPSPFSTARHAPAASRGTFGAIALVAALGTVLLAALAASATLAWAGG